MKDTPLLSSDPIDPYALVADAIRRLTDGTIPFELAEDDHSIVGAIRMDGRLYTYAWPKWSMRERLDDQPWRAIAMAEDGVRELIAKVNRGEHVGR